MQTKPRFGVSQMPKNSVLRTKIDYFALSNRLFCPLK